MAGEGCATCLLLFDRGDGYGAPDKVPQVDEDGLTSRSIPWLGPS